MSKERWFKVKPNFVGDPDPETGEREQDGFHVIEVIAATQGKEPPEGIYATAERMAKGWWCDYSEEPYVATLEDGSTEPRTRRVWTFREPLPTPEEQALLDAELAMQAELAARVPDLTPRQWNLLLDASGARAVLDSVLEGLRLQTQAPGATEQQKIEWAALKATALHSGRYTWATTSKLVGSLRAKGVPDIPSDEELLQFWMLAANDTGF